VKVPPRFEGIYVPNITPFRDGALDLPALRRIVRYLIGNGADGIVPTGTTGESPTLTDDEKQQVWETVIEEAAGQVPVIAGTGTNDTRHTIELTARARAAGADAVLVVAPYYSKPGQDGILAHFSAIASSTGLPVLIYNIPGRTGVNITADTVIRLAGIPGIAGIKESAGDLRQLMDIIDGTRGNDFAVLSGEDDLIYAAACLGGHGAIAAAAHLRTRAFRQMLTAIGNGSLDEARSIHYELLPVIRLAFAEPNPAPVKAAYELLGLCSGEVRLPLTPATAQLTSLMAEAVKNEPPAA
jgi:4-hydroxy-tetrahydrodipicolinate synthase